MPYAANDDLHGTRGNLFFFFVLGFLWCGGGVESMRQHNQPYINKDVLYINCQKIITVLNQQINCFFTNSLVQVLSLFIKDHIFIIFIQPKSNTKHMNQIILLSSQRIERGGGEREKRITQHLEYNYNIQLKGKKNASKAGSATASLHSFIPTYK